MPKSPSPCGAPPGKPPRKRHGIGLNPRLMPVPEPEQKSEPEPSIQPDAAEIRRGLEALFPSPCRAQLVGITPDTGAVHTANFDMPAEREAAITFAERQNGAGAGVYFVTNPVVPTLGKHERATKAGISAVQMAHVDCDPDTAQGYQAGRERLMSETLPDLKKLCTIVIDSGNGLGGFARYSEPMRDVELAERVNQGLIQKFGGDGGTFDVSRLMRLPGTLNYPSTKKLTKGYPATPSRARLVHVGGPVWSPRALLEALPALVAAPGPTGPERARRELPGWLSEAQKQAVRERVTALLAEHEHLADVWRGGYQREDRTVDRSRGDMSVAAILKRHEFTRDQAWYVLAEMFEHGQIGAADWGGDQERQFDRVWEKSYGAEFVPLPEGFAGDIATAVHMLRQKFERNGWGAKALMTAQVAQVMAGLWFARDKGKFVRPNEHGFLELFTETQFPRIVTHGGYPFIDAAAVGGAENAATQAAQAVQEALYRFLVECRQVSETTVTVDMFATTTKVERREDGVGVLVVPWEPLPEGGEPDQAAVVDYLAHFRELDLFLDLLMAARFASDRRQAFLWLHMAANWGKGFLATILKELGLAFEVQEKEIEAALSGTPIGLDLSKHVRAWVLVVDEFRKVSRELKMLNHHISGSAKNQLRTEIPLYLKLFTSAEAVPALTGAAGAEKQFTDRFCYLNLEGNLDERPERRRIGPGPYFRAVKGYLAREINRRVREMQALGAEAAEQWADARLNEIHTQLALDQSFAALEDSVEDMADLVRRDIHLLLNGRMERERGIDLGDLVKASSLVMDEDDNLYLVIKHRWVSAYLDRLIHNSFSPSERVKVSYKSGEIAKRIADREGDAQGRHNLRAVARVERPRDEVQGLSKLAGCPTSEPKEIVIHKSDGRWRGSGVAVAITKQEAGDMWDYGKECAGWGEG